MTILVECPCCHGKKYLNVIEHFDDGSVLNRRVCTHCSGEGVVIAELPSEPPVPDRAAGD
jgi:DnaJ-class molecular chaperone